MQKPKMKYKSIMLIDDNAIDNMINQKILESSSFTDRYYVHTSGKSALDFLENLAKEEKKNDLLPDLIFLDINMPLMDGFQFLDEFSELALRIRGAIKVYMITTSINPCDMEKADHNGLIHKFLTKPLTLKQLDTI